jgi:hypothetical protein
MDPAIARPAAGATPGFKDGLGERSVVVDANTGDRLEILSLRQELTAVPSFEFALRERAGRLANFRHTYYARIRQIDRLPEVDSHLAIVSEHPAGARLSEVLRVAERDALELDINAALCIIRQLVPAVALLHENARDVAHGALGPERIVITSNARLVITEYVLGSAFERLERSRDRLWKEFRIAVPAAAGIARFDHRADVTQIGIVALSLILGRLLRNDEFPDRLGDLLAGASETRALGGRQPLSRPLRTWLARALQLDLRQSYHSAIEARNALDEMLAIDSSGYIAAPIALESFLKRYEERLAVEQYVTPRPPVPPSPSPVVVLPEPRYPRPVDSVSMHDVPATYAPHAVEPVSGRRLDPRPAASVDTAPAQHATPRLPPVEPVAPRHDRVLPRMPDLPPHFDPIVPPAPERIVAPPPVAAPPPVTAPPRAAAPLRDAAPEGAAGDRGEWDLRGLTEGVRAPSDDRAAPVAPRNQPTPSSPLVQASGIFDLSSSLTGAKAAPAPSALEREPEPEPPEIAEPAHGRGRKLLFIGGGMLGVLALAALGVFFALGWLGKGPAPPDTGTLVVESKPPGAEVLVNGATRGRTPLQLSLPPGAHRLELVNGTERRTVPISITAGGQASQYFELQQQPVTANGQLSVRTDPPGARVTVDGQPRGVAPVLVADLAPGPHTVVVESDAGSVQQAVNIEAGVTAALVVPLITRSAPVSGWVSVTAPVEMQLFEGGRMIGTTQSDRVMVSSGRHEIEVVNETLGYRATKTVTVAPGKVTAIAIELPRGVLSVNAVPWAEVWVDGERIGETPIGNVSLAIGPHEVIFRNPKFKEQRHAVMVTLAAPARLSVDLTK